MATPMLDFDDQSDPNGMMRWPDESMPDGVLLPDQHDMTVPDVLLPDQHGPTEPEATCTVCNSGSEDDTIVMPSAYDKDQHAGSISVLVVRHQNPVSKKHDPISNF
jgi:hypothetical protein